VLATESVVIGVPAERVFKFVSDPVTYSMVDTTATSLNVVGRNDTQLRLRVRSYVLLPFLESSMILSVRLYPYSRIEMRSEPRTISLPARWLVDSFASDVLLEEVARGTLVVRRVSYVTRDTPLGRLMERLGGPWLQRHLTEIDMPRLKQLAERLA
jgi:hypothetical protein